MLIDVLIKTLGGLGLFILGMKTMTDGLQMTAGDRIKKILAAVSANRIVGCATGAFVTAVVQSSSATTVMLISFVGAGMMTLQQSVGVILGANIGTTMTAQMIAFKLTDAALPAIAIGVVLKFFSKKKKRRYLGDVVLGFGLLFFGITVMKLGLSPIKGDPTFVSFFTKFDASTFQGMLLCVATGAVVTMIVQSSSATVGLTMTLATQGLLDFPAAMALVMGENIGTTITAELATIGSTNIDAHRAARANTMFNVIGVTIMLVIFPHFIRLIESFTLSLGSGPLDEIVGGDVVNIARYIANGHTTFNVLNAMVFLTLLPWLIKVAMLLSPRETEDESGVLTKPQLDERFLDNPIAALTQARSEIIRMAQVAQVTMKNTVKALLRKDDKLLSKWQVYENHLDDSQKQITSYLTRLYQSDVTEIEAKEISSMLRMTNNIERVGDSVENIAEITEQLIDQEISLSEEALKDVERLSGQAISFMGLVTDGIQKRPANFMTDAQAIEDNIDFMREEMRNHHIYRLRKGLCASDGLLYSDILSNFEKIGDYCYNIAQAVAGIK